MKAKKAFSIIFKDLLKPLLILPVSLVKALVGMFRAIYESLISQLRFSITFRITWAYAWIITFALVLLSLGVLGGGFMYMLKSEGDDLQRDFNLISAYIKEIPELPTGSIKQLAQLGDTSVTIFDDKKKILFTTEKDSSKVIFIDKEKNSNIVIEGNNKNQMLISDPSKPDSDIPKEVFNQYGFALVLNDKIGEGANVRYIQIIDRLTEETIYAGIFIITLASLDIFFIVIIIIMGRSASKKLLRPIRTMTELAENISFNQLSGRLDVRGSKNELRDLARTFNNMLDRLQSSYEVQNQFVSDASHELRTPISVIQGYASLLDRWGKDDRKVLEESIEAIKAESEEMKNLIEKLLFLARGDKDTQKVEKQEFYIHELIDEIIKETRMIDTTHEIAGERNDAVLINADRSLLKEAIRVFVDNSVKYTPEGGTINLESYMQDRNICITIEDNGTGIPKEDIPHIFDRFYRADKSRTKHTGGTGLGMAIAKWIVLKHGGVITVQSEVDVGTKITISMPIYENTKR